ncbi:hypothetical protein EYF80_065213 [Liparis tanakae]|uniref:Uncharacterized protein n=1 Tax=Liparis tanakae TaxID=230148 RepID=A0A4Z2E7C7_9TELE|nr:hypothetical protein EYF80_065213 [Liparis tanakae]
MQSSRPGTLNPSPPSPQLSCVCSAMLPGYGLSPFPDFQPHLHAFRCRGEGPGMWIAGSAESPAPSEAPEDRPLLHPSLHPCLHKHVAVCQQETLAFIELQPNGLASAVIDTETPRTPPPPPLNGFTHTLNELNSNSSEPERHNGVRRTSLQEQPERPGAVTTVCRPLHAALSLPLTFPLSCLRADRNSWESRLRCSSSSPELPGFQSPDACQLQRRTSQGSVKEKSIRECAAF